MSHTDNTIRLNRLAYDRAESTIGKDVFAFSHPRVKEALVLAEVLNLVNGQDEDTDPKRVLQLAADLTALTKEQFQGTVVKY